MPVMYSLHSFKKKLERYAPKTAHRLRCLKQITLWPREREMEIVGAFIDPSSTVVDVGANYGIYAEFFARRAHKVLAVEPLPDLAKYLRVVLPTNTEVLNVALSDRAGETVIRIPYASDAVYESLATVEQENTLSGHAVKEIPVELARLDDCTQEKIGFIKIDVEGHEAAVLGGAKRILRNDRPNLLIEIEDRHNSRSFAEIMALLKALDYHCYYYRNHHLTRVLFAPSGADRSVPGIINYLFLA